MKHEIEIPGLPEGWEPVEYRVPVNGEDFLCHGVIHRCTYSSGEFERLIVKKKQPRRIVLEETDEIRTNLKLNSYSYFYTDSHGFDRIKIWRIVKENDLSLTNEEPKLSLTVDECKQIEHYYLSGYVKQELINKITEFLKDK